MSSTEVQAAISELRDRGEGWVIFTHEAVACSADFFSEDSRHLDLENILD